MKHNLVLAILGFVSSISLITSSVAHAYEAGWDGNHPEAKSEAWTWMGHLQSLQNSNGKLSLGNEGFGFIYYYTRNETPSYGAMNFRSSALTRTVAGQGKDFKTATIYQAQYADSVLRARQGSLELQFTAGDIEDRVVAQPLTTADRARLTTLLALFPGLDVATGFAPKKVRFQVTEEDGTRLDLEFFSIWPVVSPPEGRMRFLGQEGTFAFTEPMLVTVGTRDGKPVAGLSFLDRQWAKDYFGTQAQGGLEDLLKYGHALKFGHGWSAFHVFNPARRTWSFFHVWRQYERFDGAPDKATDYTGILWTDGRQSGAIKASDFTWNDSNYAYEQGARVLLDYPMGRAGFFPSRGDFAVAPLNLKLSLSAAPALQSLDQPIPFFEGYASGSGNWNGEAVRVQGRLESSRLLFRDQDYREMLATLTRQSDPSLRQPELQKWLKSAIQSAQLENTFGWFTHPLAILASLLGGLDLKLAIFGDILSHASPQTDPQDPSVTIYK